MYASDSFETKILNLARNQGITAPTTMYLALLLGAPDESTGVASEVSYTNYTRMPITFSTPAAETDGYSFSNTAQIVFGKNTNVAKAGTVKYVGVYDAVSAGNLYLYGELSTYLDVDLNVAPVVQAGTLKWIFKGKISNYYKQQIMNTLRGTSVSGFTPYLALYNGSPEASGSEFHDNNYSRTAMSFSAPEASSSAMKITNSTQVTGPTASGTGWGSMTHFGICDASTSGHPFLIDVTSIQTNMTAGKSVIIEANALNVYVD